MTSLPVMRSMLSTSMACPSLRHKRNLGSLPPRMPVADQMPSADTATEIAVRPSVVRAVQPHGLLVLLWKDSI